MIRQIGTTWSASFARHWGNWVSTFDLDTKDHDLQHIPEVDQSGGGGLFLLARHEARIIGTIALRPLGQRICELKRFYLLERFRGTGTLLAEVLPTPEAIRGMPFARTQATNPQRRSRCSNVTALSRSPDGAAVVSGIEK